MAKIKKSTAMKEQLEQDSAKIQVNATEPFKSDNRRQPSETINDTTNQWIMDVLTSDAAINQIVETWTAEAGFAETTTADQQSTQHKTREQLCGKM